ncbi:hypothetical protein P170DRAFT_433862 [Aspergillus steynii IBT 23096]|uniref:Uncharacterized protein n=1 Tax=Aspergillus steynii IBT 23096 TaxID=1392250 RepID=A0A2I2GGE4_9EURO|nr:uncharacterized protein P170DRAFT_433862 [Aspergillus steynii IBT 23096]PLB51958.1 hypothetical protein P170DRAFT_433862 [Aspergillus steynii IBT 23096]
MRGKASDDWKYGVIALGSSIACRKARPQENFSRFDVPARAGPSVSMTDSHYSIPTFIGHIGLAANQRRFAFGRSDH